MQTIEERSDGRWRPSPGSVYPTLAQLEDEGLVRSTESDGARHFEITDAGREHLETAFRRSPLRGTTTRRGHPLSDIGPLIVQIGKAAWQVASVGDEAQRARAMELLTETRRSLYRILAEDSAGLTLTYHRDVRLTSDDRPTDSSPPAIAVRDLAKSFGEVRAVRGVSFEVAAGEVFGFLGPQRRGQDDHDQHAVHARQAHFGQGHVPATTS